MVLVKKIRFFVIQKIIALFLLGFGISCFLSLVSHSFDDPGFGRLIKSDNITNFLGLYGAYFSSFLIVFFGYSSYLISVFFVTKGIKRVFNIFSKHLILKTISLVLALFGINYFLINFNLDNSLIGDVVKKSIDVFLFKSVETPFVKWALLSLMFILSIGLLFYSLDVKFGLIFKYSKAFYNLVNFLTKPLYVFLRIPKKKSFAERGPLKKNFKETRSEPTIKKRGVFSKNTESSISPASFKRPSNKYILPGIRLLKVSNEKLISNKENQKRNSELSRRLETVLEEYGVEGKIINFKSGPVVTLFEFIPAPGIKSSKIVGLSNDIARAMSSLSTRISSQPGKTSIGIEIPNQKREPVLLGDLIKDDGFYEKEEGLTLALGKNISGEKKFTDLEKMPHLLIAGTTGSGKSVGINSMIISLLFRFKPSECKLILIDPKMLELSIYEDIPHLLTPVVTNPNKAVFALKWVVREMENRYKLMSSLNVKNINSFNKKIFSALSSGRKLYREVQTGIDRETRKPIIEKKEIILEKMPLIVVVIDEMADLMMVAGKEVENLVQRLAQMARASGIHLIAATQRPSVDVITGTIKANFPSRISFRVASRFDSRTILNEMGAEQLLGSGDMLFLENGANITRLHGGYISESEIEAVVNHIKSQSVNEIKKDITIEETNPQSQDLDLGFDNKNVDELYEKALSIIIEQQKVSTSFIQRYLQIGYNRAARMIEKMEEDGYISEPSHAGKRSVLKKNK